MRKLKMAELIEDFDFYPRANVDSQHIREIAEAIRAGYEIDPIVVEKKTKRIVDGIHRRRALIRVYGDGHKASVVERTYGSDAEMFIDATRLNVGRGKDLDTHDKAHCVLRAIQIGCTDEDIAAALKVSAQYVGELRVDRTATSGGLTVPIKRTIKHMKGRALNQRQVEANGKLSGMNQSFYVNQVIELIDADLLDTEDENLMDRLRELNQRLDALLAATT